jgi:hypothetical protein
VITNTRRVNDVMTFPDGKFLVFTREGASDRKNGIVICSLDDPAHPEGDRLSSPTVSRGRAFDLREQAGQVRHVPLPDE